MTWAHSHADLGWANVQSLRGKSMSVICLTWKPDELWCNTEQAEEQQDGAAGSGAALLWEVAFIRVQQGSGLTPQDKGQEAVSKRAMVATPGFAAKGIVTFLSLPHLLSFHLYIITPVYQSLGASWVHRGFTASLEMSLLTGPSVSLLAQLFHLAVTITVWMRELWRTSGDTQTLERQFPVLCVPPHRAEAAMMCLLSETSSLTKFFQRGNWNCRVLFSRPKTSPAMLLDGGKTIKKTKKRDTGTLDWVLKPREDNKATFSSMNIRLHFFLLLLFFFNTGFSPRQSKDFSLIPATHKITFTLFPLLWIC